MKLQNLFIGINILRKYTERGTLDYVANSYPNGAEKNPSQLYIAVEVGDIDLPQDEIDVLKRHGWHPEDDGQIWVFPQQ